MERIAMWSNQVFKILFCMFVLTRAKQRYNGYYVISVVPLDQDDVDLIFGLERTMDSSQLQIWGENVIGSELEIVVRPDLRSRIEAELRDHDLQHTVAVYDLQKLINKEAKENAKESRKRTAAEGNFNFNRYHSYAEISHYVDKVGEECGQCSSVTIGTSFEGRPIKLLEIKATSESDSKPWVWIDAGFHAREWLGIATGLNLINMLLSEDAGDLRGDFNYYVLPVANPDGYEYSRTQDRLWRRTRSTSSYHSGHCAGVDLNRNFNFFWNLNGTLVSDLPCTEIYVGEEPFSEPESRAIRDFILEQDNILVYISLHCYSQLILIPWGFTKAHANDQDIMMAIANATSDAMRRVDGSIYTSKTSSDLYPTSGTSLDWAKGVAKIKYQFTFELRPSATRGEMGFIVPLEFIPVQGQEMWDGLRALIGNVKEFELGETR